MSSDIRLPNITADRPEEQLQQIKSYLYQFAEQLKWGLSSLDSGTVELRSITGPVLSSGSGGASGGLTEEQTRDAFAALKPLIVKSADIVNAYEEVIERHLSGEFVAVSDFGEYQQRTDALITANSSAITQHYTEWNNWKGATEGYIKTGKVGEDEGGMPVFGVEVGQYDASGVGQRFARFTSNKLSFYGSGSAEVAYISAQKLYISYAQITGAMKLGGYELLAYPGNGIYFRWVGRDE